MSAIWVLSSSPASRVSISEMTPLSCRSLSCWFMVIQPVWRHGLEIEALAKHAFCSPLALRSDVSVISPSMYCRYGVSASPSDVSELPSVPDEESVGSSVLHEVANTPSSRAEATAIGARWILWRISFLLFQCPGGQWWVMVQVRLTERGDGGPGSRRGTQR